MNDKYRNYSWEIRKRLNKIYRRVESVLVECNLKEWGQAETAEELLDGKFFALREGNETDDLEDIVATFPDELSAPTPAMPRPVLRNEIYGRFKAGIACFVARDSITNQLLGVIWLRDWYYPNVLPLEKRASKACAPSRLYTVPEARGKGIATALLCYTLNIAKQRGYAFAYALIRPKRIFSLRAFLKAGFAILGTVLHGSRLGCPFQVFRYGVRLASGSFPVVPVVIVSKVRHDGSTLLSMIRALGRNGVPVYLLVKGPLTYTGKTRYAHRIEQFTGDITDQELIQRLTAMLAAMGSCKQKPVMMHITENDIFNLHSIRPFLEKHFTILPMGDVGHYLEKANQLPPAVEAGFCVPQSMVLQSADELDAVCERMQFPIIVKPLARHTVGNFLEKVLIYDSPAGFVEQAKQFFDDERTKLLAQEYIPGSDQDVLLFMASCDVLGRARAYVSGHKLRQKPPGFGLMSSGVIHQDDKMEEKSIKLCELFKIGGFIGIEAKRRQGTQDLYYIETNFRPEAISPLAEIAGTNLVLDTYLAAIGEPCFACPPRPSASYMNLQLEIEAVRVSVGEGKVTWAELLKPLPGPTAYCLFAPDDPLPFFRWLVDAVRLKIMRALNFLR
ncbi:GNAT family N-acetyltransferase [Desulfobulbus sp.]|uniref:GNAT family N-acetyltransferase n=1 Tax=Desulfobulbus sp. TaxID=895 RepID=UPI0027BA3521|nr:GNAT family N-acetyltransferase [Desulfobulbus sp.]